MGENYWYQKTNVWENEHLMTFTPREIVDRIARLTEQAVASEDVAKALRAKGLDPLHSTPDDFAATIVSEVKKGAVVVEAAGLKK